MSDDPAWLGVVDPHPGLLFRQGRQILRFETGVMGKDELHDGAAIRDKGKPSFLDQRDDAVRGFHVLWQTPERRKVLRIGEPNSRRPIWTRLAPCAALD